MRTFYPGLVAAVALLMGGPVHAAFIETSAGCGTVGSSTSCDGTVDDDYGYLFRINEDNTDTGHGLHLDDSSIYHATLTNTSPTGSDAVIDALYFNMDAVLGTDFTIENIDPSSWSIQATSGGVQFDYIGDTTSSADRIAAQDSLVFDFDFVDGYVFPTDPFSLWTGTETSSGAGAGGGEDEGQVAVSFQTLGPLGDDSDLLVSNWDGSPPSGPPPAEIPAPGVLMLFGIGLAAMGAGAVGRRRSGIAGRSGIAAIE